MSLFSVVMYSHLCNFPRSMWAVVSSEIIIRLEAKKYRLWPPVHYTDKNVSGHVIGRVLWTYRKGEELDFLRIVSDR